jgi:hypothetical protein
MPDLPLLYSNSIFILNTCEVVADDVAAMLENAV